jgi:hypothetical protein
VVRSPIVPPEQISLAAEIIFIKPDKYVQGDFFWIVR